MATQDLTAGGAPSFKEVIEAGVTFKNQGDSPYQVVAADRRIYCTSAAGNMTVTLEAAPAVGSTLDITRLNSPPGNVIIDGNGNTINGSATATLNSQDQNFTLSYNGTEWRVL